MTAKENPSRPTYLKDADYLRDLQRLNTQQLRKKWGVGRTAVYKHLHMSGSEIRQRLREVEHG